MNEREHLVERWTSRVLRGGVWLSASLLVVGLILAIAGNEQLVIKHNPTLGEIVRALISGTPSGEALIFAGLVALMLTPFFRVATALVGFWMEKDRRFVLTSAIVLLLLLGELIYSAR